MQNQRGIALIVALILVVLLSLIGLSLTLASMSSIRLTSEFESHERAVMIADAGQSAARSALRGQSIDTLLAQSTTIDIYLTDTTPPPDGSPSLRNPRFPLEARNIDFKLTPNPVGSRLLSGMLTPSLGTEIVINKYSGRYFAKLTDNQDEAILSAPDDPLADLDGKVFLRVLGIDRTIGNEVTSHGSYFKNAVAVVETVLKRDMTFKLNSPLALFGQNVSASFDGNSFKIDGYDHRGASFHDLLTGNDNHESGEEAFSGIGCLFDAADSTDAQAAVDAVRNALYDEEKVHGEQLDDNVIGKSKNEDGTLSVNDDTITVKESGNPDAVNIFDPLFLLHFARMMGSVADTTFEDGAKPNADPAIFGTAAAPKVVLAKGDLDIEGNGSGAGILIVQGKLNVQGAFEYEGIILVVGEGNLQLGGANKAIAGGVFVANIADDGTVGTPTISINGKCEFFMKSDSIEMAYSLLPMRVLAWREITSEIEPN